MEERLRQPSLHPSSIVRRSERSAWPIADWNPARTTAGIIGRHHAPPVESKGGIDALANTAPRAFAPKAALRDKLIRVRGEGLRLPHDREVTEAANDITIEGPDHLPRTRRIHG